MASSSRLAKAIVQMAESRAEVVRKEIETEYVDYFIEIYKHGAAGWLININEGRSIFVLTEHGIVAYRMRRFLEVLQEQRINDGRGIFYSAAHAVNAMAFYGYESERPHVVTTDNGKCDASCCACGFHEYF